MEEMKKNKFNILERAFAAEIDAAIGSNSKVNLGIIQTVSKLAVELEKDGYLKSVTVDFRGLKIIGYALTQKGHFTYCMSCGVE